MPPKLMAHQTAGVSFLQEHTRAALLDDPGCGKTAQALRAAIEPVLVVAPAMIINGDVWTDEIEKWAPGLDVTQLPYSQLFVREGRKSTTNLKPELKRRWGTVVADEAHHLKNRKAFWTSAFCSLHYDRLYQLTGTPIPNYAHEAFTLLRLLWPEESLPGRRYGSYWRWVQEWFQVGVLRGRGGKILSQWNIEELRADRTWDGFRTENWGDRALRRLRADCIDLPPLTEQTIHVEMQGEQKRVYHDLKKDFVAWLDSGEEIAAWNSAAQTVKLAQSCTAVDGKGAKLDALRELLRDRESPTLVVAYFQKSAELAADAARAVGKSAAVVHGGRDDTSRTEAVRSFLAGTLDVLCATVGTISEGLNLQVADQVVFLEKSWVPGKNEQAMRRIHRIGQHKPVSAIHLVTRGSVDERVLKVLAGKTDQQARALGLAELRGLVA